MNFSILLDIYRVISSSSVVLSLLMDMTTAQRDHHSDGRVRECLEVSVVFIFNTGLGRLWSKILPQYIFHIDIDNC